MPDKEKKPEFAVTDRRLFSTEGELRQDVVEAEERRAERERERVKRSSAVNEERAAQQAAQPSPKPHNFIRLDDRSKPIPVAPTSRSSMTRPTAYRKSTGEIDDRIRKECASRDSHTARRTSR